MSLAVVSSRAGIGVTAPLVSVEAHLGNGLPGFTIVGLPEKAVKESKDRVRSAILNSHFDFPAKRITINLAPADLPKEGSRFDLPIAMSILAASEQIPADSVAQYEFIGELALSGELRMVHGLLPVLLAAKKLNRGIIVPEANRPEASLLTDCNMIAAADLLSVCAHLQGEGKLTPIKPMEADEHSYCYGDFAEVKGQHHAKRALEVAAAGNHNMLMMGPPGTGKTMLASRLPSILPDLTEQQAMETAAIASVSGQVIDVNSWRRRPFRQPHHTASAVALIGGGSKPQPGEVSLAHNGILFLDEAPEFERRVLEVMREPIESGVVTIARAASRVAFPAKFQLIMAMNPCPCGYMGNSRRECQCSPRQVSQYMNKLSGPLLDRIDLQVQVPHLPKHIWQNSELKSETSQQVKRRVMTARERQWQRAKKMNSELSAAELEYYAALTSDNKNLLHNAIDKLDLSARAYVRILRVARTLADLENSATIDSSHLVEAIGFRRLESL